MAEKPAFYAVTAEIAVERLAQVTDKGYTPQHDDELGNGQIGLAAAYYLIRAAAMSFEPPSYRLLQHADAVWPWRPTERRPHEVRRALIVAGALVVAEIERLDRAIALFDEQQTRKAEDR